MNNKIKKVAAVAMSGTALLLSSSPIFAADLVIKGNGNGSTNTIVVSDKCRDSVYQDNYLGVKTSVKSSANTGGNKVNGNTGGNNDVETGDATSTVNVSVTSGDNIADSPSCCDCVDGNQSVKVEGNGNGSTNTVLDSSSKKTRSTQYNTTKAKTKVKSRANTGRNRVKNNTGGDNKVDTGDSDSMVDVQIMGGSNTLN